MNCIFIQVCSLSFLQQILLSVHRRMTNNLNYIWDLDNPHRISRFLDTVHQNCAALLHSQAYACLRSQAFPNWVHLICTPTEYCFLNLEERMINPCTTAAQWKCLILRQVSPLMCCSSNKPTAKQSIVAFSLLLSLVNFSCISNLQELMKGHTRMSNKVLTN